MAMVEKYEWQAAIDLLNAAIAGQMARLEIADPQIGDQVEAEWSRLEGLTYDAKGDQFEIQLEGVDHLVSHPRSFAIREHDGLTDSLAVLDEAGTAHILQLREPIRLPPPRA